MEEKPSYLPFLGRSKSLLAKFEESNSPEKLLVISFVFIILLGSILLSFPFTNAIEPLRYIDNLFVSVSAVCVTGLSPLIVAEQYNTIGKTVMIFLMEIGGLGPMTIVAIVIQRNRKRMATVEKKLFAMGSGKSNLYDVPSYIRKIFKYTLFFETLGFIVLSLRLVPEFGVSEGLFNSLFLSVSAFTNAGFDCFAYNSLAMFAADPLVNFTVMVLIITGGLGFVVWFELNDWIVFHFRQRRGLAKEHKYLSVHAVVVLKATLILLVSGTVLFYFLQSASVVDPSGSEGVRLLVSMFQSVTLRTAGFSTVTIGLCSRPMLLIMCVFMLIGGSPGGTAGGIKTTTAVVLIRTAQNTLDEKHDDAVIHHRRISPRTLKHAFMILTLYISLIFTAILILAAAEPHIDLTDLIFETFSAIATVGLSTGITPLLSDLSMGVIMVLMFIGRVGPVSLYAAFHKEMKATNHIQYPDANIIIG